MPMMYRLYNSVVPFIALAGRVWLRVHPDHRQLLQRFRPDMPPCGAPPLWVHACSVGEVNTARPIIHALQERFPDTPVLLSVSTASGHALAQKDPAGALLTWFPFDVKETVRHFVRAANPRALILIETEIWPNVLRETRRFGAPVIVVNGRLSDKHIARYRRWRRFFAPIFMQLTAVGAQNDDYARRFIEIGADPAAVKVTGNTKFDGVITSVDPRMRIRSKAENGFPPDHPILLFGSTRPGDEALAAQCWRALREEFPSLRLVVAPRHRDRLEEAMAPFDDPILRRSEVQQGRMPAGERVFFLDTVGELVQFYAIASVAVVGGSFYPGVNGHNPLEPAALGAPTVFGPYMSNFTDPARALTDAHGAIQLRGPESLCETLRALLRDPARQRQLGTRGRKAVLDNRGAVQRNVDLIADVLNHAK
ncbi:MAG TPA: 3-deoxy-D-manno-octulosonic acid transferase, partial [Candidatus Hydrogenedentes bacterium]|nr:3-deoxy-D-manno-octulosonic acid transferase [Candidatus Hydrogenedentota bacterium]